MKKTLLLLVQCFCLLQWLAAQQQTILINNFDNKPATETWWRHNRHVSFSYNSDPGAQVNNQSTSCLHVRWDSTAGEQPFTWFTDLKADSLSADGMEKTWQSFQQNTWLSFWCKGGDGDTLMLHYLVLSKGHSSKWGATNMIPVVNQHWTFYKIRFTDLQYEDWGKVKAPFDLNSTVGRCFEVGLRSGTAHTKGYIEAWFDDIQLTNFEPFK